MVSVTAVGVGVTVVRVGVVAGTERSGQPVLGDLAAADGDRGFRGALIAPEGVLARGQSGGDGAVDDPGRGAPGVDLVVATGRGWVGTGTDVDLGLVVLRPGVPPPRPPAPADVEHHRRLTGMS